MASINKDLSIRCVLHEPNITGVPADHTRYGVTLKEYQVLVSESEVDWTALEEGGRAKAYELLDSVYWSRLDCNVFPVGIDYFVLDSAVVFGRDLAKRWATFSLGFAAHETSRKQFAERVALSDPQAWLEKLESYRRRYAHKHKYWELMQEIWTNRTTRARVRALKMMSGAPIRLASM